MPHLTIEYSANLDRQIDMSAFCLKLHEAALKTKIFEVGAIRVRAVRCEAYAIADRMVENAFVDLSLRVGTGRSLADRKAAGEVIYAAALEYLAPLLKAPHFALSFEIREIDPALSWKTNAMHARLRKQ